MREETINLKSFFATRTSNMKGRLKTNGSRGVRAEKGFHPMIAEGRKT